MMVSANSASCMPAEPIVAGPSALKKRLTSSSSARPAEFRQHLVAARVECDQPDLEAAGDQHAPGRRVSGGRKEGRERERRHHRQIEQDRRRGRRREALQRIEDAAIERHQRDQQQIGKGDAREIDREREAGPGSCAKPGASTSITAGVNTSATASSTIWLASSSVKMRSANSRAASAPPGRGCAHRPARRRR